MKRMCIETLCAAYHVTTQREWCKECGCYTAISPLECGKKRILFELSKGGFTVRLYEVNSRFFVESSQQNGARKTERVSQVSATALVVKAAFAGVLNPYHART